MDAQLKMAQLESQALIQQRQALARALTENAAKLHAAHGREQALMDVLALADEST